jgi:hypothetical protein
MKTFKTFFEDQETALVPSAGEPLSSFLQRFEGSTIKQILDKSSFINLYFGNKYGLGGPGQGRDKAIQDFSETLTRFVNRDEHGRGPASFRPRVYETDEFKANHNYAEYQELDVEFRKAFRRKFEARRAGDEEALAKAEHESKQISDAKNNSEFGQAERKARQEEDEYVETLHNTPLSMDQLSDDGSKEYKELEAAYNRVIDYV